LETTDELIAFLTRVTGEGFRGRLLDRGTAWSLMREAGTLPPNAPAFGRLIETDLADYGFSVLRAAMALRLEAGPSALTDTAFERAALAFEALIRNGDPATPDRGFVRTLAATAYHLAGFSAVAYALFKPAMDDLNVSPGEVAIRLLILRDLNELRAHVRTWANGRDRGDQSIASRLADDADPDTAVADVTNATICRALGYFDFALATGENEPLAEGRRLLADAVGLAAAAGNVPLWWTASVCRLLIDDLWRHSLHNTLPMTPPEGAAGYPELRRLFVASLYARTVADVELWPSQREAAQRATDVTDDLVVSLPTSAGKTRIAEIAALMTLATGRRVLVVTPLRALSAQTERSFRRTFAPLGYDVSSLYGASGLPGDDRNLLRTRAIVVTTPEKLDFALRSDPTVIDDVGLVVLDEGHMVGPGERELRYEVLVQRLLRRADAAARRIVCLSAVLPSGDELDDLTSWLRRGQPGAAVQSDWRPTRQRFGTVVWRGRYARLNLGLETDAPFVERFVRIVPDRGQEPAWVPEDTRQLTLATAWEFARRGKRVLVFSTQANWVAGYAKKVVQLGEAGHLAPLATEPGPLARVRDVGIEWLGEQHPAVACLRWGVAIHYRGLPRPFLRELEAALSAGALPVTIASPTLAQGLNLSAAVLLVPYLYRAGTPISGSELANVAGRAGRAFVDTEGLVLHVVYDKHTKRLRAWRRLVTSTESRTLVSGLRQLIALILERLAGTGILARDDAWEYLANAREPWQSNGETGAAAGASARGRRNQPHRAEDRSEAEPLSALVARLDLVLLGLIEALAADSDELPRLLDEVLRGSLWARQLAREADEERLAQRRLMEARATVIWRSTTQSARRGHFAMGVGLEAGLEIDALADEAGELLDRADRAGLAGDLRVLTEALAGLGERLLHVEPFRPARADAIPPDWVELLAAWIAGRDVPDLGPDRMPVIEELFVYRLVWALEAVRVRRVALGWTGEIIGGVAAAVVEAGVPDYRMAMLIRAGLPSRRAAMAVVEGLDPRFLSPAELRAWLTSDPVAARTADPLWPTQDTASLWARFREEALAGEAQRWSTQSFGRLLAAGPKLPPGLYRLGWEKREGRAWLVTPDFRLVAPLAEPLNGGGGLLCSAQVSGKSPVVEITCLGPTDAVRSVTGGPSSATRVGE
jgi:hypothetical protein